jgi:predicted secreted hydrolase
MNTLKRFLSQNLAKVSQSDLQENEEYFIPGRYLHLIRRGPIERRKIRLLGFAITFIAAVMFYAFPVFSDPWPRIEGPCGFEFPKDHGMHGNHRTEWWYYTGNLNNDKGMHYGFQLTFFRSRISPPGIDASWPNLPSPWRTRHIFLAHAAVSKIDAQRFFHEEATARGIPGIAGVVQQSDSTRVFLKRWDAVIEPDVHRLKAIADDFSFELNLVPEKPLVPQGVGGYSLKGEQSFSSSCYYSFTRLKASGKIEINGKKENVTGQAWMDHEYSSAPLETGTAGWDWFSLQFDNNTELMIYLMRLENGGYSPASGGTFVDASANTTSLKADDFKIQIRKTWKSAETKAVYPLEWDIDVIPLSMKLHISANMAAQEMLSPQSTGVTYWEGSITVKGTSGNDPVNGKGYMELTGYDKPFDAPM